jgi:diguanylate cyclase (GGDEF)-like protein/PAS domain S-box-containing protein
VRTKTLLAACVALLLLMLGVFEVSRRVLTGSFADIESATLRQSLQRVTNAMEADLGQIAVSATDYAHWDDTYGFVYTHDPAYIEANITTTGMANIHVDLVWIMDDHGHDVMSVINDPLQGLRPVSDDLQAALRRLVPLIRASETAPMARLVSTPAGVLAIAARSILHNDQSGPSAGLLVFGRLLAQRDFERLEQTSQLPVHAVTIEADRTPVLPVPEDVTAWLAGLHDSDSKTYLRVVENAETLDGYALLRDIEDRPVLLLSTSITRDVMQVGKRTITGVIIALIGGFALVVLAMLTILSRSWRAQQATESRYVTIASQLDEAILVANETTGVFFDANNAATRMLGYEKDELLEMRLQDVVLELPPAEELLGDRTAAAKHELMLRGKGDRRIPVEVTATALRLERRPFVCLVARDITARKQAEIQRRIHQKRLSHLALHDTLTKLPNRLHLRSRLPKLTAKADAEGSRLALLYVDLDHFKDINDSLGHGAGDQLLVSIAQRLRAAVASTDLVVRMGGDEFVVIAGGLRQVQDADRIARRIQDTLSAPFEISGARLNARMSIGIAVYPDDGADLEQLLKHADIALYQAKDLGRGNHQFFTHEIGSRLNERLSLGTALRSAIGTDQIYLEYQPAYDIDSRAPVALEALMRWRHPELGAIAPGRFIPIAEQSGLIHELGNGAIRRVCQQLAEWQARGLRVLPVSVNVSARQFEQGRIADRVAELCREHGIDPKLLAFEITESVVVHNSEQHLGALQALRNLGSKIHIDDFGTGYSSLSYLKNLPIDTLKIDRSFVSDMPHDDYDVAIVRGVVGIARSLGLQLVAEGVETAEQLACLRELGCPTAQGFYFSRPLPVEQCEQLLERHAPRRRPGDGRVRLLHAPGPAA